MWSPFQDINMRGSFATGFLPPSLHQLVPVPPVTQQFFSPYVDPRRGNTLIPLPFQELNGGGAYLLPEDSRSWSFGAISTPSAIPGFRASIDFTSIAKSNEIVFLLVPQILANEEFFPGRVIRADPSPSDGWPGPITFIDATYVNLAKSRVEAMDIQLDYVFDSPNLGNFRFYGVGSRSLSFRRRLTPSTAFYEAVGKSDGPLKWRGNIGLDWSKGKWRAGWSMQYYDGYSLRYGDPKSSSDRNIGLQGGVDRIPSQAYHDFNIAYQFTKHPGILSGLELSVAIRNAFDKKPPAVAGLINGYSYYGDPRLRRVAVAIKKHFGERP
jgi:outer membrane receptor protein involved in Fe transport